MKIELINRVKEIYESNGNIMKYLQEIENRSHNTVEDIMISYDFQAGSYNIAYEKHRELYTAYHNVISNTLNFYIKQLQGIRSYKILEAGIGEGTTFGPVMRSLEIQPEYKYGFDISWSRVKECNILLNKMNIRNNTFTFVGDIFQIPIKENSIDIVYTAHALEPNGGKEKELLKELYRIASKYVILFEPAYEFADEVQKKRMEYYGYVKSLPGEAEKLGYKVIDHKLLDISLNKDNPTAVTVIYKGNDTVDEDVLCCPLSKGELIKGESSFFSKDCLLAYPIIEGIPCLNIENGILATGYIRV